MNQPSRRHNDTGRPRPARGRSRDAMRAPSAATSSGGVTPTKLIDSCCCGSRKPTDGSTPFLGCFIDAPEYMQHNKFILTGYRINYRTIRQCLRSAFAVHNETGNVWTHFLGFFVFILLSWHVFSSVLREDPSHYVVFILFIAGCLTCMLSSTVYHLLSCHSLRTMEATMCCDYCGISSLIIGSFIPPVYFAFGCQPYARIGYLTMIGMLGGVSIVAPFFRFFDKPEFHSKRVAMYCLTVASGVVPSLHAMLSAPINRVTLPLHQGIGLMFLFYGLGTVVYVTRVPERWFPGRFDLWLHSHQLWHMFVVCAAIIHFYTCVGVYQRHSFDQC